MYFESFRVSRSYGEAVIAVRQSSLGNTEVRMVRRIDYRYRTTVDPFHLCKKDLLKNYTMAFT